MTVHDIRTQILGKTEGREIVRQQFPFIQQKLNFFQQLRFGLFLFLGSSRYV